MHIIGSTMLPGAFRETTWKHFHENLCISEEKFKINKNHIWKVDALSKNFLQITSEIIKKKKPKVEFAKIFFIKKLSSQKIDFNRMQTT